jgi:molybdate transport system substrate-binding protein
MKSRIARLSLFAILVLVLMPFSARAQTSRTLTVFAASSLTDVFEEIAENFKALHPGVDVITNFGASSTLATQLAQGALADVFASANTKQMDVARKAGRIAGEPQIFAKNRLVLIVPVDNPAHIGGLIDLAKPGVKLVVAAPGTPIRDYTDSMLDRLAADPGFGEAYRAAVIKNIVSEEANVRQVSLKVALGEADAGIVYLSDVTPDIAPKVIALPIPDAYNSIATYPIAATNDSAEPELARAFIAYVLSDAGQETLAKWGFVPVRALEAPATATPMPTPTANGELFRWH